MPKRPGQRKAVEPRDETGKWMHAFSKILICPPEVELLRIEKPT